MYPFFFRHPSLPSIPGILLCLMFFTLSVASAAPPAETARVYTNSKAPSSTLSASALRSIFSMRLTLWPDGSRIQVVVLDDSHPLHRQFSKSTLGLFPYQLRQLWDRGVFSGTGEAPLQASSEQEMLEILITTPGAIGYLLQQPTTEGLQLVEQP